VRDAPRTYGIFLERPVVGIILEIQVRLDVGSSVESVERTAVWQKNDIYENLKETYTAANMAPTYAAPIVGAKLGRATVRGVAVATMVTSVPKPTSNKIEGVKELEGSVWTTWR